VQDPARPIAADDVQAGRVKGRGRLTGTLRLYSISPGFLKG
jgi:hypothetical protein